MEIHESRAYRYAQWCIDQNNKQVPKYIKLQAKSWIDIADEKDQEAYVDQTAFNRIAKILKLIVHPDLKVTMDEGLEDYAWFLIVAVFCTKQRGVDARFYITALLEIARKNFKTFNSATMFIIAMLTEPQFSRFFSVAPDLKLSSELKLAIKKIIKASPALADDGVFKLLRSEIRCILNDSEYTPLAYSEDRMDGKLANMFLADEAGAMDSYPIEAMRSSQITLLNKLGIIISTQYPNDNNAMIDEVDISKKVLEGLIDNRRRFSLLYEPDDYLLKDDKWMTDDLVIYQSNPVAVANSHILEAIKDMRTMAVLYENKRENFLCKHCNIKYKGLGVEGYVEITKVRECKATEDLAIWKGRRVYVGLDLSQTEDNTAIAMVAEVNGKLRAKTWGFLPKDRLEIKSKKEDVNYPELIRRKWCFACGDAVIDYGFIEIFLLEIEEKYGVEIVQIGYDRYNALSTIQKMEAAGYECVDINQHSSVLHMPTKLLKESILNKTFEYDENQMLEINFQNAKVTKDTNLKEYVNKKRSSGKVDMVVSLINAVYLFQQDMLFGNDTFIAQT